MSPDLDKYRRIATEAGDAALTDDGLRQLWAFIEACIARTPIPDYPQEISHSRPANAALPSGNEVHSNTNEEEKSP